MERGADRGPAGACSGPETSLTTYGVMLSQTVYRGTLSQAAYRVTLSRTDDTELPGTLDRGGHRLIE